MLPMGTRIFCLHVEVSPMWAALPHSLAVVTTRGVFGNAHSTFGLMYFLLCLLGFL